MKKGSKQSTILPTINELKNNSVGNTENEKVRIKAICVLADAKQQESIKKSKGHKYMSKGKTSVLVSPERFSDYFRDGFKFN